METEKNKMAVLAGLVESKLTSKQDLSVIEIIDKFDYLKKAFKYIIENNKSNDAPYHNLNHLLTVTKAVYDGMHEEDAGSDKMMKEMLISAIFHDFNHSVGKKTDDKNIEDAKKGIKDFLEQEKIDADFDFISQVLDATQYPYVIPKKHLNLYQRIMRDADIVQVLQYNWIHQSVFGLSQELGKSFKDFISAQKKFVETIEFNTSWGERLKKEHWDKLIKETEILENIFK